MLLKMFSTLYVYFLVTQNTFNFFIIWKFVLEIDGIFALLLAQPCTFLLSLLF